MEQNTTPSLAVKRYKKAYSKYLYEGMVIDIRMFCKEEGLYYAGFVQWLEAEDLIFYTAASGTGDFKTIIPINIIEVC
ncbi:MAG: hypothetical protein A2X18_05370 [Bacteroidetes bacterium GWF2_40_14]|nr:MAG: hypothetical protein A2X18_05370 [Bacteroidetes bacterium GWF2_40_14]